MVHVPAFFETLGANTASIGLLYSASAALGLILRPVFGRILDATHRRTVLWVATAANTAVILGLLAVVTWSSAVWVLFLVHRSFRIALITAALTYAADAVVLARRTQGLAIFGLSGLVPIAIGGILGDLAIGAFGFDGLFWGAALLEVAALGFILVLPLLPVQGREPRRGFWVTLRQRNLIPIWVAALALSAGFNTMFAFAKILTIARGVGSAGLLFGVYGLAAGAVRIIIGPLYDRSPHRKMIVGSIIAYSSGLVLMALADSAAVIALAGLLSGLAHGTMFPILTSQLTTRSRLAERGSAMTILTSVFDVAVLVIVPVAGLLINRFSYTVGFAAVAAFVVAGAAAFAVSDQRASEDPTATGD